MPLSASSMVNQGLPPVILMQPVARPAPPPPVQQQPVINSGFVIEDVCLPLQIKTWCENRNQVPVCVRVSIVASISACTVGGIVGGGFAIAQAGINALYIPSCWTLGGITTLFCADVCTAHHWVKAHRVNGW